MKKADYLYKKVQVYIYVEWPLQLIIWSPEHTAGFNGGERLNPYHFCRTATNSIRINVTLLKFCPSKRHARLKQDIN